MKKHKNKVSPYDFQTMLWNAFDEPDTNTVLKKGIPASHDECYAQLLEVEREIAECNESISDWEGIMDPDDADNYSYDLRGLRRTQEEKHRLQKRQQVLKKLLRSFVPSDGAEKIAM